MSTIFSISPINYALRKAETTPNNGPPSNAQLYSYGFNILLVRLQRSLNFTFWILAIFDDLLWASTDKVLWVHHFVYLINYG